MQYCKCVAPSRLSFLTLTFAALLISPPSASAQSLEILYSFTGAADGDRPQAGIVMDRAGNLYGTTCGGSGIEGPNQSTSLGTVYKLSRSDTGWIHRTIYAFQGGMDGIGPCSRVIFGLDGSLYGTTVTGGIGECSWVDPFVGCGTVFKLSPPHTALGTWTKSVIHYFNLADGAFPILGDLTFDASGNIYGTTWAGGSGQGTVYELIPTANGWTETVIANMYTRGHPGLASTSGVVFDAAGNLYGTTWYVDPIGARCLTISGTLGTVFRLTPSGSDWVEEDLYCFRGVGDGAMPFAGVVLDDEGNLYGSTTNDARRQHHAGGTLFRLEGHALRTYDLLYHFEGNDSSWTGPWTNLTAIEGQSGQKNFYGMTHGGGAYGGGSIFSWTHQCGDTCDWQLTTLWNFGGVPNDGGSPISNLVISSDGYAYGTTNWGGAYNKGTVFRIYIGATDR